MVGVGAQPRFDILPPVMKWQILLWGIFPRRSVAADGRLVSRERVVLYHRGKVRKKVGSAQEERERRERRPTSRFRWWDFGGRAMSTAA